MFKDQLEQELIEEEMEAAAPIEKVDQAKVTDGAKILTKYKEGKQNLEKRIVENEKWYKMRHWEVFRKGKDVEPSSAWLFNSLYNKHADVMDNYPEPNVLPREQQDEEEATKLSSIVPVVLEHNDFEETYSDVWWYKLKNGVGVYGVFWNQELENGLGDIDIKKIDLLNVFWEPGVSDIQKSRNLFVVNLVDTDILEQQYPDAKDKLGTKIIDVTQYVYDDNVDTEGKTLVVDWYYKSRENGKDVVHFIKFAGDTLLYATENEPELAAAGIYEHGKYPIFFDVLFPLEGTPVGFGYIDIMKDTQMYIDKLNQIIIKNAALCGRKRYFVKDNGSINEAEFADLATDFVHVEGQLTDEHIREIQVSPLDGFIVNHLQMKIDELKETSGNRDFSQGSTSGGVTAASAIAALQEAGNKLARDMIRGAYRVFAQMNYMCIELIRQFYDETRSFRITGEHGEAQFMEYNNMALKGEQLPLSYPGEDQEPGYEPSFRSPVFDIKVKPQKANPFSRMAQNELAKELYAAGFFNPQMADQALIALDLMHFEGKEKVVEKISMNQTLMQQLQMMQERMAKMAMIISQQTGIDVMGLMQQEQMGMEQGAAPMPGNVPMQEETYTDRVTGKAKTDMERQG